MSNLLIASSKAAFASAISSTVAFPFVAIVSAFVLAVSNVAQVSIE